MQLLPSIQLFWADCLTGLPIACSRPDNSPDQLSHLFSRDTRRCPVLNSYASVISVENGRTPFSRQSQYTLVSPGCRFLLHKDTGCGNGSRTADLPAKESLPTTVLLFLPAAADLLLESHSAKIWYRGERLIIQHLRRPQFTYRSQKHHADPICNKLHYALNHEK